MAEPHLPERVVTLLISSDYARLVGSTMSERFDYIVDIASLHTRDELLRRHQLDRVLVRQVEKWLAFHGRRLRRPAESIDIAMCSLEFRKRRIRRSRLGARRRRLDPKASPKEPG
ncbi:hypothetical protein SSBR45G_39930 [Bradyrhizobium sp. SSBR45G]|uniref:hypothetical protein n=1 Tax=unclassified Bradyrhizobium TaxID=2631580 RepID=UPI002342A212|nr:MULTISPECIES: hypothetical protein [unclassified Bradyrhizobium]GLH79084.1 hypothetical protein SSBR45G_39930 [Bradyrhizobium sp. SSBR45G]GLH86593.1 hypothetical protein SSBR45R_40530 [Bradyrhizobium sp. SSBR45R]